MNYQKKTVWSSQMRLPLYLQNKMIMNNMKNLSSSVWYIRASAGTCYPKNSSL